MDIKEVVNFEEGAEKAVKRAKRKVRLRRGVLIFDFFLIVLFVALVIIGLTNRAGLEQFLSARILSYGVAGLFAVNFFLEFIPQIITPFITLVVALSTFTNLHLAIFTVVLGSFFGSWIGFEVGKKYGFDIMLDFLGQKKTGVAIRFMNRYGRLAVFLASISPLPYIPMIIGALNMTRKNFVFFGLLPRAIALFAVGYGFVLGFL